MHGWGRQTLEIAEPADRMGEMSGIFKLKHCVRGDQRFDLHRPDVRKYGWPLVQKDERPFVNDRFQLGRSVRPLLTTCRGDGVEEAKTASHDEWVSAQFDNGLSSLWQKSII